MPMLSEIADGVFAWLHDVRDRFTCNVGVVVGDDALTLIDASGVPSSYRALALALERFARPVARLVLTHAHPDHVAGAAALAPAEIVTSAATAGELAVPAPVELLRALHPSVADELAGLRNPAPTRRLDHAARLDGRIRVELARGHSSGDLVLQVEDAGVWFVGDLCFFGHVPLGIGADFEAWIAALDALETSAARLVPGHGPVGSGRDAAVVRDYLCHVVEAARGGGGIPPGPWDGWWDPWAERIPGAVHRINLEQARGERPDTLLALAGIPAGA